METSFVASALHFEDGIDQAEHGEVIESFHRLEDHLRGFPDGTVVLRLHVKERGTPSQRTSLATHIAGHNTITAISNNALFRVALGEVRDETIRQLTDAKTRAEPANNRTQRSSR